MISESFYDILCITYDFKTLKGRFPGITKSKPVSMPPDAAGSFGAKISMHDQVCKFWGHTEVNQSNFLLIFLFPLHFLTLNVLSHHGSI